MLTWIGVPQINIVWQTIPCVGYQTFKNNGILICLGTSGAKKAAIKKYIYIYKTQFANSVLSVCKEAATEKMLHEIPGSC